MTLAAHPGANLVYEAAGMHASLLGCCCESMVIDDDMLGAIDRTVRGIEVDEDTLSLAAMRETCLGGPNHYLGNAQTLRLMQREYVYPEVGDRTSPKEWGESGKPVLIETARRRVEDILATHWPEHVPPATDETIRAEFDVKLPRELMRAPDR